MALISDETRSLVANLDAKRHGVEAESAFAKRLRSAIQLRTNDFSIFSALRVPQESKRGKWEIDFLVLTKNALIAIELKSWTGHVATAPNGQWQQSTRDKVIEHKDPAALNREKLEALVAHLQRAGVNLDPLRCHSWVVIAGTVSLDSKASSHPDVVMERNLEERLTEVIIQEPSLLEYFFSVLVHRKKINLPVKAIERQLRGLPTWDTVSLIDGSSLAGDIEGFAITGLDGRKLGRDNLSSIVVIPRNGLIGFILGDRLRVNLATGKRKTLRIDLSRSQSIQLRLPASSSASRIPLADVAQVTFGHASQDLAGAKPKIAPISVGSIFTGPITGIKEYGIFVRLVEQQDGLIHISELANRQLREFSIGQLVSVRVLDIGQTGKKQRISLSLVS